MNINIRSKNIHYYLFILLFILNFLPFYMGAVAFICIFIFLLAKGYLKPYYFYKTTSHLCLTLFAAYSLLISLFHLNGPGLVMSVFYFILILYFSYYVDYAPAQLFDHLINICMIASLFIFAYTIFEYFNVFAEWDYSFIHPAINTNHADRVEATFFNPNYYAMVLEFFILIALYKSFTSKTQWHQSFYLFILTANSLAIIFTGNRTAPLVLAVAIVVFFYVAAFKKTAIYIALLLGTAIIVFILSGHYPRLESLSWAIEDRIDIWQTAAQGLNDHIIFGQGPYSYIQIFQDHGGKFTYHAHNIYLDTLINYGIVGCLILLVPLINYAKSLFKIHHYPRLKYKAALIWSLVSIFIVHGLTDLAIYWFQTMGIFLPLVLLLPSLIKEEGYDTVSS